MKPANIVSISEAVEKELQSLCRKTKLPKIIATRAEIFLMCANGEKNCAIAEKLGVHANMVSKWRQRFVRAHDLLERVEEATPDSLTSVLLLTLDDAPRSGHPPTFTQEQKLKIIEVACTPPRKLGVELPNWTTTDLALMVIRKEIVESISPASIWRILETANVRPWKCRYWLNSPERKESSSTFKKKVRRICRAYRKAAKYAERGYHVISIDEMTGVQALERKYKDLPVAPGHVWRQEFEYIRHGTVSAIVAMEVGTGKIYRPYLNETRTEEDFVAAIRAIIATDPDAGWIVICDGLNTHMSAKLVELVAELLGIDCDTLGVKGKSGILENMRSRAAFLGDERHRIYFLYTPKHCSWVNMIEIFFSVITRKLLRRSSYKSKEELKQSICTFIKQYNVTAEPYKWTYTGKVLAA